jgi:hypothetical protein
MNIPKPSASAVLGTLAGLYVAAIITAVVPGLSPSGIASRLTPAAKQ